MKIKKFSESNPYSLHSDDVPLHHDETLNAIFEIQRAVKKTREKLKHYDLLFLLLYIYLIYGYHV